MGRVCIWLVVGLLCFGFGSRTAVAQEAADTAPTDAAEQPAEAPEASSADDAVDAEPPPVAVEPQAQTEPSVEDIQQMPVPNLSRSSWIVLMAILGEQLPEGVVLEEVAFLDRKADATIRVLLPRANAAALQSELMESLERYFATVEAEAFTGPGTALYLQGAIRLSGVPTLAVYRQRKSAADAVAQLAPPPGRAPAPPPRQDPWPRTEVRQVFRHGPNEGVVAQLLLNGSEYIVREGRAFASNQYRFVGVAPPSAEAPNRQCVVLERLATGDTRTFCMEATP